MDDATVRGRSAYQRRAWSDAYETLPQASAAGPLGVDDVERLAWSAVLSGRDDPVSEAFERIYQLRLGAGEVLPAARVALWLALRFTSRGEMARASGWLMRAQRLVDRDGQDCVERGYLRLPQIFRLASAGDHAAAQAAAAEVAEIGDRYNDHDLSALGRTLEGRALIRQSRLSEGLPLLDEAMVAATSGSFHQSSPA